MPSLKTRFGTLVLVTAAFPLQSLASPIDSYDYIIVGAGTSGLLLANRLSQDANFTVVVIDPGADERNNANVVNPLTWLGLAGTSVDWSYSSIPQVSLGGRVLEYDAGRGIGGTSLINGMDAKRPRNWDEMNTESIDRHDLYPRRQSSIRCLGAAWKSRLGLGRHAKVLQKG